MSETSAERWLPVVGYEGSYEVSDLGRVRTKYGSILRPSLMPSGHLLLQRLKPPNYVHRLVLEAFVGPCPPGMEGCHGPGGPGDNRLVNLRWDIRRHNRLDATRHSGASRDYACCPRGHRLVRPNLRESEVKRGRLTCRACDNASSNVGSSTSEFFHLVADRNYARIMRGVLD